MVAFPEDEQQMINNINSDHMFAATTAMDQDEKEDETSYEPQVLGKGTKDNLIFEWITTDWSKCSETCGGNGFQMRAARCIVRLHNTTQGVDDNLCDDAGLEHVKTIRKCGFDECPKWTVSEWSPCEKSKCFALNKGTLTTKKLEINMNFKISDL